MANKKKRNLLVFAGAGASVSLEYPTTAQFIENLNLETHDHHIYQTLPQEEKTDIERVLWFLQETILDPIKTAFIDNRFLYEKLLNYDATRPNSIESYYKAAKKLESDINKRVHDLYGSNAIRNTNIRRHDYWVNPLVGDKEFRDSWNIEIFTTNYDRAIEKALLDNGIDPKETDPFLQEEFNRVLDISNYRIRGFSKSSPWLTKLHGSLEWRRREDGNIEKTIEDFSDNSSVLYPGFKGEPTEPPFKEFHEYFASCLEKCNTFLSIGFSYRDEYINKLIKENLKRGTLAYIIDPSAKNIRKNDVWKDIYHCYTIEGECNRKTMLLFQQHIKKEIRLHNP